MYSLINIVYTITGIFFVEFLCLLYLNKKKKTSVNHTQNTRIFCSMKLDGFDVDFRVPGIHKEVCISTQWSDVTLHQTKFIEKIFVNNVGYLLETAIQTDVNSCIEYLSKRDSILYPSLYRTIDSNIVPTPAICEVICEVNNIVILVQNIGKINARAYIAGKNKEAVLKFRDEELRKIEK